jgi:hypothetical protein
MAEVVERYFRRRIEEDLPMPELAVIDGGKGQLSAAVAALREAGVGGRAAVRPGEAGGGGLPSGRVEPYRLPRNHGGLRLLQRVRNEAHRFAHAYNRKLRGKRTLSSELAEIPGVGPKRQQVLLSRFGSVRALREVSPEELAAVPGILRHAGPHDPRASERRMSRVRTRFAPSPTGSLHVGNARTAVLNWLIARHHGGDFILRIEDTDAERNVPGAEARLMADLQWLGLDWDEGPEPEAAASGGTGGPTVRAAGTVYGATPTGSWRRRRLPVLLHAGDR